MKFLFFFELFVMLDISLLKYICRMAAGDGVFGNITDNAGTGLNNGAFTDVNAVQDNHPAADPDVIIDDNTFADAG